MQKRKTYDEIGSVSNLISMQWVGTLGPVRRRRASQLGWEESEFCLSPWRLRRQGRVNERPSPARSAGNSASAERRLRAAFSLGTFFWPRKRKYLVLADETAIKIKTSPEGTQ